MNNLIERYVYDVTRRLPEKERTEVGWELRANIEDMIAPGARQAEVEAVLYELGSPAELAAKYRTTPSYLIGPRYYDDYIRAIKWITPLVGVILLVVGAFIGGIDAINGGLTGADFMASIIGTAISLGVQGALQALMYTTVGFVIAERVTKSDGEKKEWQISDLPEVTGEDKNRIRISDTVVELVFNLIFTALAILFLSGNLPVILSFNTGTQVITEFLAPEFVAIAIPLLLVGVAFSIVEDILKLVYRRWNLLTCGATLVSSVVNIGLLFYILCRPQIFSTDFIKLVSEIDIPRINILGLAGNLTNNPVLMVVFAIVVIIILVDAVIAVHHTIKAREEHNEF